MRKIRILIFLFVLSSFHVFSQGEDCDGRRPDINTFEDDDIILLASLILQYVQSNPNEDYNPDEGIEYKYPIIAEHFQFGDTEQTLINHSNKEFLIWHRQYISGLEDWLLENDYPQFVPLPTWSSNTQIPEPFYNTMPDDFLIENQIFAGTANGGSNAILFEVEIDEIPFSGDHYQISDQTCLDSPTLDDFGDFMARTDIHTGGHGDVGGVMSIQTATSGAPLFWLLHANVDEYYYCYQIQCECPTISDELVDMAIQVNVDECSACIELSNPAGYSISDYTLFDNTEGEEVPVDIDENGCIINELPSEHNFTLRATIKSDIDIECPDGNNINLITEFSTLPSIDIEVISDACSTCFVIPEGLTPVEAAALDFTSGSFFEVSFDQNGCIITNLESGHNYMIDITFDSDINCLGNTYSFDTNFSTPELPEIIFSTGPCSLCIELSQSGFQLNSLIAINTFTGVEYNVDLGMNGCMPYGNPFEYGTGYRLIAEIDAGCNNGEMITLESQVWTPAAPFKPCNRGGSDDGVSARSLSSNPGTSGENHVILIENIQTDRYVDIYNVNTYTGKQTLVLSQILLSADQNTSVSIPNTISNKGLNRVVIKSKSEIISHSYIIE